VNKKQCETWGGYLCRYPLLDRRCSRLTALRRFINFVLLLLLLLLLQNSQGVSASEMTYSVLTLYTALRMFFFGVSFRQNVRAVAYSRLCSCKNETCAVGMMIPCRRKCAFQLKMQYWVIGGKGTGGRLCWTKKNSGLKCLVAVVPCQSVDCLVIIILFAHKIQTYIFIWQCISRTDKAAELLQLPWHKI